MSAPEPQPEFVLDVLAATMVHFLVETGLLAEFEAWIHEGSPPQPNQLDMSRAWMDSLHKRGTPGCDLVMPPASGTDAHPRSMIAWPEEERALLVEAVRWVHRTYPYPSGAFREAAVELALHRAYVAGWRREGGAVLNEDESRT